MIPLNENWQAWYCSLQRFWNSYKFKKKSRKRGNCQSIETSNSRFPSNLVASYHMVSFIVSGYQQSILRIAFQTILTVASVNTSLAGFIAWMAISDGALTSQKKQKILFSHKRQIWFTKDTLALDYSGLNHYGSLHYIQSSCFGLREQSLSIIIGVRLRSVHPTSFYPTQEGFSCWCRNYEFLVWRVASTRVRATIISTLTMKNEMRSFHIF